MLELIRLVENGKGLYKCICGTEKEIRVSHVNSGSTKSCGCHRKRKKVDPDAKHRFYGVWRSMLKKISPKNKDYIPGLEIEESFKDFSFFKVWAEANYNPGIFTRIDLSRGYSIHNCKFATKKEFNEIHSITTKMNKITQEKMQQYKDSGTTRPMIQYDRAESKRKRKETNLEKYGNEVASKTTAVKNKIAATNLKKYGVASYFQTKECEDKLRSSIRTKYGCDYVTQNTEMKLQIFEKLFAKQNKIESQIKEYLNNLGFSFVKNRKLLAGKEIDMYDSNLKIGVEYSGIYWHTEQFLSKRDHYLKHQKCKELGIRLIHIFSDEWSLRQKQVKNHLNTILGLNEKIYARKCVFKSISGKVAKDFINEHHIQELKKSPKIAFGLFYCDELYSVMTFTNHHRDASKLVLNRFCTKSGYTIVGGASKLFTNAVKVLNQTIYSWSDNRYSDGNVYEKLGFKLEKELVPDYSYVDNKNTFVRIPKQKMSKKNIGCPESQKEHEFLKEKEIYRIWDCGKKLWVFKISV